MARAVDPPAAPPPAVPAPRDPVDLVSAVRAVRRRTGARVVRAVDGRRGTVLAMAGDPRPEQPADDPAAVTELVARAVDEQGTGDVAVTTGHSVHVLHAVPGLPGAYVHLSVPVGSHTGPAAAHPAVDVARRVLADPAVGVAMRAALAPVRSGPLRTPVRPRPARGQLPALVALAPVTGPVGISAGALAVAVLAELTPALPRRTRATSTSTAAAAGVVTGLPRLAWAQDVAALNRVLAGLRRLT